MIRQTTDTKKAVAPVIGFVLILAILFLAAAQYQANVVPAEERSAEIDHFSDITEDMSGLRSSLIQTSSSGQTQTQELNMGVSYGILGLTQPPRPGTLTYINSSEIKIMNAENNREASNFWRGDVNRTYDTGFLQYRIDYNRLSSYADIYIEHGMMYRDTAIGSNEQVDFIEESEQQIIRDRNINLYTIDSSIDTTRMGSTTVEMRPTSAPMNSVSISDVNEDNPLTIRLPTRLSEDDWERMLENELTDNGGYIEELTVDEFENEEGDEDTFLELQLETGETYNLQMSKVNLLTQDQQSTTSITEPEYIAVDRQSANLRERSILQLNAEVRDKYNNGVIGTPVRVEAQDTNQECIGDISPLDENVEDTNCIESDGNLQPGLDISSSDGSVKFEYEAPEIESDVDVIFIYEMLD